MSLNSLKFTSENLYIAAKEKEETVSVCERVVKEKGWGEVGRVGKRERERVRERERERERENSSRK